MPIPNTAGFLTWDEFIRVGDAAWHAWIRTNQAFLQTPRGQNIMANLRDLRANAREAMGRPEPARSQRIAQLKAGFQKVRANVQQNTNNPAAVNPTPGAVAPMPAAGGVAPGAPPAAAAAPVAPPVYLPNVNAPNYMFPTAEAVRDMTYNPGIGGFMRPNQWQPGVPAFQPQPVPQLPPYMPPSGPPGNPYNTPGAPTIGPGYTQPSGPGTPWYMPPSGPPSDKKY